MINTKVIYATKTNHSKKYAQAAARALGTQALDHESFDPNEALDILFIAGGIYGGKSLPKLIENLKTLDAGRIKTAVLITSNASKKFRQEQVRTLLTEKGIKILDEKIFPGSFLFMRAGHPNNADIKAAADFAVDVCKRYGSHTE